MSATLSFCSTFVTLLCTVLLLFPLAFLLIFFFLHSHDHSKTRRIPPSPQGFPIVGHLHLLKPPVHRTLASVSARLGPVVLLRFGSRPVLLVSLPSAVEDCFTTHDVAFANRPRLLAGRILGYGYTALGWAAYGPHWRNLRRITTLHLLSSSQLRTTVSVRSDVVRSLAKDLFVEYSAGADLRSDATALRRVEMKSRFFDLTYKAIMSVLAVAEEETAEERIRFRDIMEESFKVSGAANLGDFLPGLKWVGWGGLERRLLQLQQRRDEFLDGLIMRHRRRRQSRARGSQAEEAAELGRGDDKGTVINVMLSLQDNDPEYYTDDIIKGVVMVGVSPLPAFNLINLFKYP